MSFSPGLVKPKTIKVVFDASLLSIQYQGVRAQTGYNSIGISIMCPSGATCLTVACYSDLAR